MPYKLVTRLPSGEGFPGITGLVLLNGRPRLSPDPCLVHSRFQSPDSVHEHAAFLTIPTVSDNLEPGPKEARLGLCLEVTIGKHIAIPFLKIAVPIVESHIFAEWFDENLHRVRGTDQVSRPAVASEEANGSLWVGNIAAPIITAGLSRDVR